MSVKLQIFLCLVVITLTVLIILKIKTGSFNPRNIDMLKAIGSVQKQSVNLSVKRYKKSLVRRNKNKFIVYYYKLVQLTLDNLQLSSTVEWFTFLAIGVSIIVFAVAFFTVQSIAVSLFTVIAIVSAGISLLATMGKRKASIKLNAILDATDVLCAYIEKGLQFAIRDNLDNFDVCIRQSFEDFLAALQNGVLFDTALKQLNNELGHAFDNFAHKASIYQHDQIKGQRDIFRDIIDDNAVTREMNIKKEDKFDAMNSEFFLKTLVLGMFVAFTYFENQGMHYFFTTINGKGVLAMSVVVLCLVFTYTQLSQLDLTFGGEK